MFMETNRQTMDKSFWHQIKENDFALPDGYDLTTLTDELFGYLGSPDETLRGAIAYVILEQWIREKNLYSDSELTGMLDRLLGHLHKGIGEAETDSVFLRSFSLWALAFILQRDIKQPFLSVEKFTELVSRIAKYVRDEQDLRGWVDGKGWVHTTAHIASLLSVIAQNRHANTSTDERILALIAEHMTRQTDYVYGHGEDDRMAQTVVIILESNHVDIEFWRGWLKQLESIMDLASAGMPFDIRVFHAYTNTRNFIRALYFPIELCMPEKPKVWTELRPALHDAIREVGLC
jgi:hypothetical protein